jgi:hypothetical protein
MVSHLFFYQLVLIALVWLCLMLHWMWPSAAATCPTTPEPTPQCPSAIVSANPLQASPQSLIATPVHTPATSAQRRPAPRHRASCPHGGAAARSTPRHTSARTQTVPIAAGSAGAISAPMAIRVVAPGGSCCVSPVAVIFSRPSARSSMASAPPSSSSCASSPA